MSRERATKRGDGKSRLVRQVVNGKSELLPDDPFETANILAERRHKSPGAAARVRMLAAFRKRGIRC